MGLAKGKQQAVIMAALVGGFSAGTLDILYAFAANAHQAPPIVILQSIASGLLGRAAYDGGNMAAAIGLSLHFVIALAMALAFALASTAWAELIRRPIRWGIAYGLGLYLFMNLIVLPLSAFPHAGRMPELPLLMGGLMIHALGVGLPISFAARHFLSRKLA